MVSSVANEATESAIAARHHSDMRVKSSARANFSGNVIEVDYRFRLDSPVAKTEVNMQRAQPTPVSLDEWHVDLSNTFGHLAFDLSSWFSEIAIGFRSPFS